jgi:hypothetical protein
MFYGRLKFCRKTARMYAKSCEQLLIANNLKKAGWSLGYVSALDSHGRTIWIADAHRSDGRRFVVHADEKLTALVELESAIRASDVKLYFDASTTPGGFQVPSPGGKIDGGVSFGQ